MALFEGYERRIAQINKCLNENGIASIEEAEKLCKDLGLDVYTMVKEIQTICFENACFVTASCISGILLKNSSSSIDNDFPLFATINNDASSKLIFCASVLENALSFV